MPFNATIAEISSNPNTDTTTFNANAEIAPWMADTIIWGDAMCVVVRDSRTYRKQSKSDQQQPEVTMKTLDELWYGNVSPLRAMHSWRQAAQGTAEAGCPESRGTGWHAHGQAEGNAGEVWGLHEWDAQHHRARYLLLRLLTWSTADGWILSSDIGWGCMSRGKWLWPQRSQPLSFLNSHFHRYGIKSSFWNVVLITWANFIYIFWKLLTII